MADRHIDLIEHTSDSEIICGWCGAVQFELVVDSVHPYSVVRQMPCYSCDAPILWRISDDGKVISGIPDGIARRANIDQIGERDG